MNVASFLSDGDIHDLASAGTPPVDPFNPDWVQAASVDLRLSGLRHEYDLAGYTLGQDIKPHCSVIEYDQYDLLPGRSVSVGLLEQIVIPEDAVGFVFARSSLTRIGLLIAPVFMNPGYVGVMPITVMNSASFPITLLKHVRVAQLILARLKSQPKSSYGEKGRYAQERFSPTMLHSDVEIKAALARVMESYYPKA